MSGYPYDTATSFVRYPAHYVHDAFGHVGADDAGKRQACFRSIPHTGIDVSPDKVGDTTARVVSPVFGTIVETGVDAEAGLYHIIKADGRAEWWVGGHHSRFEKRGGRVARGELIARMGATGGAKGVHVHWTVATSLAAARRYITGYVNYRNGRTIAAWAATMGLVDPWPLIEREWAAEVQARKTAAAAAEAREQAAAEAAAREEEEAMSAAADDIKEAVRRESRPRLIRVQGTNECALVKTPSGFVKRLTLAEAKARAGGPDQLLTKQELERHPEVDRATFDFIIAEAEAQLDRIGKAVADELVARGRA